MTVEAFTKSGTKASTPIKLNKIIFEAKTDNHELLKLAYVAHLTSSRINLAKTKKRGQVRGGGQKPWRQKGTGRARVGSSRNPLWRGGGIAFGPTGQENYLKKVNLKAKRQAIVQALTLAQTEHKIKIVESLDQVGNKTKDLVSYLSKIDAEGRILVVIDKQETVYRSARNVKDLKVLDANYLSVFYILNADCLIITMLALERINQWLGGKNE